MKKLLFVLALIGTINCAFSQLGERPEQYKVEFDSIKNLYNVITIKGKDRLRGNGDTAKYETQREVIRDVFRKTTQKKRQFLRGYIAENLIQPKLETEQSRLERVFSRDLDTTYTSFAERGKQDFYGEWILRVQTDTGRVSDRVEVFANESNLFRVKTKQNGTSEIATNGTFRGTIEFELSNGHWITLKSSSFDEPIWLINFNKIGKKEDKDNIRSFTSIDGTEVEVLVIVFWRNSIDPE